MADLGAEMTDRLNCDRCERSFVIADVLAEHAFMHSFNDISQLLKLAVRANISKESWIVDVGFDWVVFEAWDEDERHYSMWRAPYTFSDSGDTGSVDIDFEAKIQVLPRQIYVEAPTDSELEESVLVFEKAEDTDNVVHGTPADDHFHGFTQLEAAHPFWCSDCGRRRNHPVHNG